MKIFSLTCLVVVIVAIAGCGNRRHLIADRSDFGYTPESVRVRPRLNEASGIADYTKSGVALWVIEDSGHPAELLLLQKDGNSLKRIPLKDGKNTDWEAMALVNGDIYIADMGDNLRLRKECTMYRFPEPEPNADTIYNYQKIRFTYPDKAHDAEGFLVDPESRDIFIITKSGPASAVYKLAYPYTLTGTNTLVKMTDLPYTRVTDATISRDGKEILVKTYKNIYYYKRNGLESLDKTLAGTPVQIPYEMEPQGEGVAFAHDGTGFYTLSEKGFSMSVNLFFYKKR